MEAIHPPVFLGLVLGRHQCLEVGGILELLALVEAARVGGHDRRPVEDADLF